MHVSTEVGKTQTKQSCSLCHSNSVAFCFFRNIQYYRCIGCYSVFMDRHSLPDAEREKMRYLKHNNDINDIRFQAFVKPLAEAVMNTFTPQHKGLDFGAGTGSAVAKLLNDNHYQIAAYDPFFHNHPDLLNQQYDYIICCEVIEHFHHPHSEFTRLRKMLKPGARLFCKTALYSDSIDFVVWTYKNDFTHVFFYSFESLLFIAKNYTFSSMEYTNEVIIFSV